MNRQNLTILAPQALDMGKDGGGSITSDTTTMENVAGVLAKLSDQASMYVRLKELQEYHYRLPLIASLIPDAIGLIKRFKKRNLNPQPLIETALNEAISTNICSVCNGVKFIRDKQCLACNALGVKGFTDVDRCKGMQVPTSQFKRDYAAIYEATQLIFQRYEAELSAALYKSSENY